jgi:signal transduction histidine kinase
VNAILPLLVSNSGESSGLIVGVLAILLAQAALITGLIVQRRRKRQVEERLRCREAELRISYDRIRDVGGRLLTAQEAERSRIARELHDDIGQQLALLRFDLHHLSGDAEALCRLDEVAKSVHDLSHRLHPAKLQLMGLVPSLRALAREHSRTGIAVSFTHTDVPPDLSPALTLCLFRVIQESLGNTVKYGHAASVRVELQRDATALTLTIVDDGVGFDVEKAWGKGLGLVSIRERVESAGGTVVISSRPGSGTRFDVRVPLEIETRPAMNRAALASVATQRFTSARQAARERSIPSSAIFADSCA